MTDTVIIGAGLSGLTTAYLLRSRCYGHSLLLLEKSQRTGGALRTLSEEGFTTEWAAHGFLDNCRESRELLAETGLESECVRAPLGRFVRHICLSGRLRQIPQTPRAILSTPLLGWKDKGRVLADLWRKPLPGNPSVARWAEHRFGPALLPFVDAALTGTYGGDMDRLGIEGVMPGVRALEARHGSVIRGLLAARSQRKSPRTLQMPAMTSFPGGMQRLPERLTEFLRPGVDLLLERPVLKVRKCEGGWHIDAQGQSFTAANLVLAVPVNTSLALLRDIASRMPLPSVPEAKIATVALGFGNGVRLPPGFGYLIPESEGRFTLGTLFSSNMFPGRAPGDGALIEVLVGGRRHPERLELDDQTLLDHALTDVRELLAITAPPLYSRVLRGDCGIPQPEEGYPKLLTWRNELCATHRGLHVCGFGWDGIGINDMIRMAARAAGEIMAGQGYQTMEAPVKGVYF